MEVPLSYRAGAGYDVHRLVAGRRLVLGGVAIPFEQGLLGHSDADVVLHALGDALLGAAGLGDIGELFSDTDPQYHGADSRALLKTIMNHVRAAGYVASNVDVTIVAEQPRLSAWKPEIRASVAAILNVLPSQVNIKAATNEGLDALGRGEAIACHALALLRLEKP